MGGVAIEVLVGLVAVLVCAFGVGLLWLSRLRTLNRRTGSFSCSTAAADSGPWRRGIAQYGRARMYWWRRNSLSPRAAAVWSRSGIVVLERRPLPHAPGRPVAVLARCRVIGEHGTGEVFLQMSADAYAGFTSWIEATPRSVGSVI